MHALSPLAAANPKCIRVLSRPTMWRGALWLPYRREPAVLQAAVVEAKRLTLAPAAPTEEGSPGPGDTNTGKATATGMRLDAIFCHADVVGASMNETYQAKDGVDPNIFAVGDGHSGHSSHGGGGGGVIPTYTGHYHKPHTVPGTRITYVGSPYQVSRAEAGQIKALVVLDAEAGWSGWTGELGRGSDCSTAGDPAGAGGASSAADKSAVALPAASLIRLDLGPRHFTVKGEDAAVPPTARAGDIVRWALPLSGAAGATPGGASAKSAAGKASEPLTIPAIEAARSAGIFVEVSYDTVAAPPRIPKAEEMGPNGLYDAYAKAVGLSPEVVEEGRTVLAEVAAATAAADVDGTSRRAVDSGAADGGRGGAAPIALAIHSVEVEGFGAFTEAVQYPLHARGVCAVVGDNRDDQCADSNGAGKTTLVMAPMWCLTGQSDLRMEGGAGKALTKVDVVNDGVKAARVRLEGSVDGQPFWVLHTRSPRFLTHSTPKYTSSIQRTSYNTRGTINTKP